MVASAPNCIPILTLFSTNFLYRANAVFFVPYDPSSSRASNDRIHHYTLPSPVLDIAVPLGEDGNVKNRLWVSIDSSFESDDDQRSNLSKSTADNLSKGATAELNVDKSEINGLANNIYLLEWRGDDTVNFRSIFPPIFA